MFITRAGTIWAAADTILIRFDTHVHDGFKIKDFDFSNKVYVLG